MNMMRNPIELQLCDYVVCVTIRLCVSYFVLVLSFIMLVICEN